MNTMTQAPRAWIAAVFLISACVLGYMEIEGHWSHAQGTSSMLVGAPTVDQNGVRYYPVRSVYQGYREQIIRVLQPTHPTPGKPRVQLYVLPVDVGVDTLQSTWSDGLEQLRLLDVPNRFNMTLIAPSFHYEPWYGDNVDNRMKRMESFVIRDLVPFGDSLYHGTGHPDRDLIGFSKSGNAALFLILRHPGVFSAAAAWDCPAEMDNLSRFHALAMNFGTEDNYRSYDIPELVKQHADAFRSRDRLWISGDQGIFTPDMVQLHKQLTALSIPHIWIEGGPRQHSWRSGWLANAVAGLSSLETPQPGMTNTAQQHHMAMQSLPAAGAVEQLAP